ncbi:Tafazzin family protein [Quillaja saponaria]|uniref:Tafazzin family protein n=1 Tax=Quillaja saponaria TaxID=32244 RepID=A0AAD7QAH6_QUISA|nr:Tafazzin family protein [Quillaja saponaria]
MQRIDHGDLWKNKARYLQLQLRDRFRVAVDRHRSRQTMFSANGYFSSTMQRWLQRFRDFRRESLPSSSFYLKRVSRDFNAEEDSVILRMLQAVAVPVLGNVCHVFMHGLNRVQVYGVVKLHEALLHRPKDRPLLTVSNHVASVDDPFVTASLLPPRVLFDAQNLRWTLCASDRCFKNPITSTFFKTVKVLPVSRGDGIYQKGMDMAISKLNRGGWVHIFPEGSRSRDGGKTMGSSKRGVGRLILDADNIPMVVPFVHTGMQEIMPVGASIPRIGKTVTVIIGDPIHFDDLLNTEEARHVSRGKLYDAVASRIGNRLQELKVQVDKLAIEEALHSHNCSIKNTERAAGILQMVDWESLGMESYLSLEGNSTTQRQEILMPPTPNVTQPAESSSNGYQRMGFSSRIRDYMDQTELMSFAARGLFVKRRAKEVPADRREVGPLMAWKQFLEAHASGQWNYT